MSNTVLKGVLIGLTAGALFFPAGCAKKVDTAKSPQESRPSETATQAPKEAPVEMVQEKDVVVDTRPAESQKEESSGSALADVYFDFDQSSIRDDAKAVLDANARLLQKESGLKIVVEGYCDERGTSEYNLALGEKRAQAVKRYLEALGIAADRLRVVSYGEEKTVCSEADESCYQKNRRAHFGTE